MSEHGDDNIVELETAHSALCGTFLAWQCRVRQMAVREHDGRPAAGMRPLLTLAVDDGPVSRMTTVMNRRDANKIAARFRHIVRKTHDPAQRLEGGLRFLSADYYQSAENFSDLISALFSVDSTLCQRIADSGRCELDYEQTTHAFRVPCFVRELNESDPVFQATYWHNHLFNPRLPGKVRILGFRPDWSSAAQLKG